MSVVVLDTNVVSYVWKGHSVARLYARHLEGKTLAISFMTVGELWEGAFRAGWGQERIATLKGLLRRHLVIPASPAICRDWGQIRSARRAQPISAEDAWIAACARIHACPLVTHNPRDFSGIEGLKIVSEPGPAPAEGATSAAL